jgi:hypothetical protein
MTALNRNPSNPNLLHPNKFQLNFARAPNVSYFCQSVSLPGISTQEIPVYNPFVEVYAAGEKTVYDTLNVTFYVDEEMKAWIEVHDWIRAMTFPEEYEEYVNLKNLSAIAGRPKEPFPQYSDLLITVLSSSNKPYYQFKFFNAFPVSLSPLLLSSSDSPESVVTADATFRYTYYDILKLF